MADIRTTLRAAITQLSGSSTPRLDAQVLLCHVLGVDKRHLIAHDDRQLTEPEQATFNALVARRANGEPIAYIVGRKQFYGLDFIVTPDVLIPRPETEHLVEAALDWAKNKGALIAADIGTGSGAIALSIKQHAPNITMHAVDVSAAALTIAQRNAAQHKLEITWYAGSLAEPLQAGGIKVDLLLANMPYVASETLPQLAVSQHEPLLALDGGPDGLDLVRALLQQIPSVCQSGALILLEIGAEQGAATLQYAREILSLAQGHIIKDLAGLDRVVVLQLADSVLKYSACEQC